MQSLLFDNRITSSPSKRKIIVIIYDGDSNLVKKINRNGSKTVYTSTTPRKAATLLRLGVGRIYEVDKTSGGAVQRAP